MKAVHYVLTEAEHSQQLEATVRTVFDPAGQQRPTTVTIPATFQPIDRDALTYVQREEAMVMAGLDKYVGGVAFGQLTKEWRGHKAGSFAIRHLNSSGYHVHVFDAPVPETAEPVDAELAKLQADEDLERLEAARKAQQEKDAPAAEKPVSPAAAAADEPVSPANDNAEGTPTPAPAEPPAA